MQKIETRVKNSIGLHARPASICVKTAQSFSSAVTLLCGDKVANAKSIFSVLSLGASCGTDIIVQADGEDENEAAVAVATCIQESVDE